MTPQLLIVRIQALLGGRTEMSPMQKRSLAMEYYRQCSEAEAQVEHCISLLKAGREYAALQAAEASSLLDSINALLFEDLDKWREYCQAEGFPVPVPFDYSQIEQIAALYSKGITQAHPLYRDYRRAMRMRNYQKALSIIRTITKINAFDAAAKREYDKLRKHVAEEKMPALADALKAGDNEKIVELLDSIGNDSDAVASNPTWIAAVERRRAFEAASAKKRMREILSELERVDPANDWERALELVTEANLLRGDVELGAAEVEVLENYLKTASARHDEILAAEKASEARNLLLIEMEQPSKGSARKKLAKVSKLRKAADPVLEGELRGVIDARVKKLRLMALASAAVYVTATAIAVIAVVSLSYIGIDSFERARAEAKARGELAAIEALWDISAIESRLQEFEEKLFSYNRLSPYNPAHSVSPIQKNSASLSDHIPSLPAILLQNEPRNQCRLKEVEQNPPYYKYLPNNKVYYIAVPKIHYLISDVPQQQLHTLFHTDPLPHKRQDYRWHLILLLFP